MTHITDEHKLLSLTEAADILGVSRATAYNWARTGRLPVTEVAGRVRVPRRALDIYLERINQQALESLAG